MSMIEIGGYMEMDTYSNPVLHSDGIALNSARNCLAYLIETRHIAKIAIPKFLCNSVADICRKMGVVVRNYSINNVFLPDHLKLQKDEWLYLVNYYGQVHNKVIVEYKKKYDNLIVDNVQSYYQDALEGVDTIYTCRKYFGVPDGAFLYSNKELERKLEQDSSQNRMGHIIGRLEGTAEDFYSLYKKNEDMFQNLPLRTMSKLTKNLLRGIDFEKVRIKRERNFLYLNERLGKYNGLCLDMTSGPFMYPLYVQDGNKLRGKLLERHIYIPTLWPDVLNKCNRTELEYDLALNILPLPIDQRYSINDMCTLCVTLMEYIK